MSRMALGLFEAFCGPAGYSLIADYFPAHQRTTAIAVYIFGNYAGGGLSSLIIPLIGQYGWRNAYLFTGIIGIVIGVLALIIIGNPTRGRFDKISKPYEVIEEEGEEKDRSVLSSVWNFLKTNAMGFIETFTNKTCLFVLLASCARLWSYMTIVYYSLEFFADYGKVAEYGILNSCAIVIGGFTSNFVAGQISDRLETRFPRIKAWLGVIMSLLGVVMNCVCFLYTDNFYVSMTFQFFAYLLTEGW